MSCWGAMSTVNRIHPPSDLGRLPAHVVGRRVRVGIDTSVGGRVAENVSFVGILRIEVDPRALAPSQSADGYDRPLDTRDPNRCGPDEVARSRAPRSGAPHANTVASRSLDKTRQRSDRPRNEGEPQVLAMRGGPHGTEQRQGRSHFRERE